MENHLQSRLGQTFSAQHARTLLAWCRHPHKALAMP